MTDTTSPRDTTDPSGTTEPSGTTAPARHRHAAGPAIAILRGGTGEHVEDVIATLVEAGVRAVELTTNTPRWRESIAWATERYGDTASIGVGTVMEPRQLDEAAAAGAVFAVSPHLDPAIGERAHERGLGWYPGAATPTEIVRAWQLGARAVKVFPAAALGGPAFLGQVLAPLDFVDVIPTGGIGIEDAPEYLAAGAVAVGLGSPLVGDALSTGDLEALRTRAERLVAGLAR